MDRRDWDCCLRVEIELGREVESGRLDLEVEDQDSSRELEATTPLTVEEGRSLVVRDAWTRIRPR